eukprot:PhF_6_TR29083/c1_g1_i2/m.42401/K14571/RIX7, NVL; ribosome biogenesis ATPase
MTDLQEILQNLVNTKAISLAITAYAPPHSGRTSYIKRVLRQLKETNPPQSIYLQYKPGVFPLTSIPNQEGEDKERTWICCIDDFDDAIPISAAEVKSVQNWVRSSSHYFTCFIIVCISANQKSAANIWDDVPSISVDIEPQCASSELKSSILFKNFEPASSSSTYQTNRMTIGECCTAQELCGQLTHLESFLNRKQTEHVSSVPFMRNMSTVKFSLGSPRNDSVRKTFSRCSQLLSLLGYKNGHQARATPLGSAVSGILLTGSTGTGKTYTTRMLAAHHKELTFYLVNCPLLFSMYLGESEENIRTVFRYARRSAPCVLVLDEIDAICMNRSKSNSESDAASQVGVRVLSQLLCEMDGFEGTMVSHGVMVIGTTNQTTNMLDPAILRAGRLEVVLHVT